MKFSILFTLALATVLFTAQRTWACACSLPPTDTEEQLRKQVEYSLGQDTAIFLGRVKEKDARRIKFKVERVWKGEIRNEATLATGAQMLEGGRYAVSTCVRTDFVPGRRYLIFASGTAGGLSASKCSWTMPVNEAVRFVRELDRRRPEKKARVIPGRNPTTARTRPST
ncbi:MAG TPA: hypothetical protein VF570_12725 [Pyrinomonadaceae bacterium]